MSAFLAIIVSGLLATAAMTLLLYLVHSTGLANADMLRAIGTLFTRRDEGRKSTKIGFGAHFIVGVLFAFFYVAVWSLFNFETRWEYMTIGALVGFAHGLAVSVALVILVAEHHPLERFRSTGFGVAMAHLGAHVVYGLVLGLAIYWFNARYDTMEQVAKVTRPLFTAEEAVAH